jgi:alpha-ketoglutarate-dependent 2,4-dichlorophenoxyacetate dioxygenase
VGDARGDGSGDGGRELIEEILAFAQEQRFRESVEWKQPGDLVVWDNTAVMHRAGPGTFAGRFKRDMRRCTVHDGSSQAWGLNERSDKRMGLP